MSDEKDNDLQKADKTVDMGELPGGAQDLPPAPELSPEEEESLRQKILKMRKQDPFIYR